MRPQRPCRSDRGATGDHTESMIIYDHLKAAPTDDHIEGLIIYDHLKQSLSRRGRVARVGRDAFRRARAGRMMGGASSSAVVVMDSGPAGKPASRNDGRVS